MSNRPSSRESWAIGDGWVPTVTEAVRELEAMGMTIAQVKEKFGHLRIYFTGRSDDDDYTQFDAADAIVRKAELACAQLCETCGSVTDVATRNLPNSFWLQTLCLDCHTKREAK